MFWSRHRERRRMRRSLDLAMAVEAQVTRGECRQLLELARRTPTGQVIVEIGSYRGASTIALALGARAGSGNRVYAVDPHSESTGVWGGQFGPADQAQLYQNLSQAGVGDLASVVSLPSVAAARAWEERNIGLLWIDGDHRYEASRADYEAWLPFLVAGATVVFHDIDTPGVSQLLSELGKQGNLAPEGTHEKLAWFRLVNAPAEAQARPACSRLPSTPI